jgi:hypothetical protein
MTNYVYTSDEGDDYQVGLPADFADALGLDTATSEPVLPQEISPRYVVYACSGLPARQAVISPKAALNTAPQSLEVSGNTYNLVAQVGQRRPAILPDYAFLPSLLSGPKGDKGDKGDPGGGGGVSAQMRNWCTQPYAIPTSDTSIYTATTPSGGYWLVLVEAQIFNRGSNDCEVEVQLALGSWNYSQCTFVPAGSRGRSILLAGYCDPSQSIAIRAMASASGCNFESTTQNYSGSGNHIILFGPVTFS